MALSSSFRCTLYGGVVTPAEQLAVVVPSDAALEVEAMISNRDIGFVYVGQDAQIKVDTFNFTRYGLLHGKIFNVSQDAIIRDAPPNKTGPHSRCWRHKQRTERRATQLCCARITRSGTNTGLGCLREFPWHGSYCGSQDWLPSHHHLSAFASSQI